MSFIFGFIAAFVSYWLWGLFTKGFAEELQSYYGKLLFSKLNFSAKSLEKKVAQTVTKIDDVLIGAPVSIIGEIDRIVNQQDLRDTEKEVFQTLLDQTYKLSVLLEKYNVTE